MRSLYKLLCIDEIFGSNLYKLLYIDEIFEGERAINKVSMKYIYMYICIHIYMYIYI